MANVFFINLVVNIEYSNDLKLLAIGGSFTRVRVSGNLTSASNLVLWDVSLAKLVEVPKMENDEPSSSISSLEFVGSHLAVAGHFIKINGINCPSFCLYDSSTKQWTNPIPNLKQGVSKVVAVGETLWLGGLIRYQDNTPPSLVGKWSIGKWESLYEIQTRTLSVQGLTVARNGVVYVVGNGPQGDYLLSLNQDQKQFISIPNNSTISDLKPLHWNIGDQTTYSVVLAGWFAWNDETRLSVLIYDPKQNRLHPWVKSDGPIQQLLTRTALVLNHSMNISPLSTGAIIGIVLASLVLVGLLTFAILFWFKRKNLKFFNSTKSIKSWFISSKNQANPNHLSKNRFFNQTKVTKSMFFNQTKTDFPGIVAVENGHFEWYDYAGALQAKETMNTVSLDQAPRYVEYLEPLQSLSLDRKPVIVVADVESDRKPVIVADDESRKSQNSFLGEFDQSYPPIWETLGPMKSINLNCETPSRQSQVSTIAPPKSPDHRISIYSQLSRPKSEQHFIQVGAWMVKADDNVMYAKNDYQGQDDCELSFKKGDAIYVSDASDRTWW